jgi:hypothetical protein
VIFDPTAGFVETPGGVGKFVEYDGNVGVVAVEMDNQYLVFYPAGDCFIKEV